MNSEFLLPKRNYRTDKPNEKTEYGRISGKRGIGRIEKNNREREKESIRSGTVFKLRNRLIYLFIWSYE